MQADSQQQHNLSSAATSLSPNAGHARRKRYKCRYKTEWMEQWPFILPVPHDPHRFFCSVCCREVSCSHQGKRDVERHVSLMMHANNAVLQFEQPVDYRPPVKTPKLEPVPLEPKQEWIEHVSTSSATSAQLAAEEQAFDFTQAPSAPSALPYDLPKFPSPPAPSESPQNSEEPNPCSVMADMLREQRLFHLETKNLLTRQMELFSSMLEESKLATACLGRITAQNEAILRELRRSK